MNTIQPLSILASLTLILSSATAAAGDQVQWQSDVETALRSANRNERLVLMKFTADWCGYCKKMERETFTKPTVAATVNRSFVPVLVDADEHADLLKHLKIKSLPSILVVSPQMVILKRINGYRTQEKLMPDLQEVIAEYMPTSGPAKMPPTTPARTVSQRNNTPTPSKAPPTTPSANRGPAFGGLCLPSVHNTRSLVSGRPEFALRFRGKTVYFQDAEQLQTFRTEPAKYWPAIDGTCPVTLATTGKTVEGKLEFAAMYRGKLWLSSTQETMKTFVGKPAQFVEAVQNREQ